MKELVAGAVLGVPLFLWGLAQFRKSRAASSWPAAPGWIVQCTVTSEVSRGDDDNPDTVTYYPAIVYQYQVGAQLYQNNRIAITTRGYQHPQQAQAALAAYPAGSPHHVYFNPANPQEAILEPGHTAGLPLMGIGALIVLAAAAAAAR